MPARRRKPRLIGFNLLTVLLVAGLVAVISIAIRRCTPAATPPAPAQPTSQAAAAPRIIAMSPAIAIILSDLGLSNAVVGRHAHDMVLDKSVPVCGDQNGLDYEAILNARPTHIFMQAGAAPVPPRLTRLAAEHGWTVTAYPLLTLDDIRTAATGLRSALPYPAVDPFSIELVGRMESIWSRRGDGFAAAGRVLLLESLDPPAAFGPGSFHQQVLERIGGTPAITEGKVFITMDAEDVLRLAPDAIIIFAPRPFGAPPGPTPTPGELRASLGRLGTLDIPALKSGRLARIDHPLSLTPSTAMLDVADEMAQILGRWSKP